MVLLLLAILMVKAMAKALGLALDASGRILITGFNSNDTNQDIFIARIEAHRGLRPNV